LMRLRIIYFLLIAFWIMFVAFVFWPSYEAKADPPHPSTHIRWEAWPNGTVVLYFNDGMGSRYMYRMVHAVEPASNCVHVYGDKIMRLITFDTTYPYFYTVNMIPFMRWDNIEKEYVRLK